MWFWSGAGAFFIGLIAWRLLGAEDLLRAVLRDGLQGLGAYLERRSLQGPLIAMTLVGFALAGAVLILVRRRIARRARFEAIWWAAIGMAVMCMLIILRLISLHGFDAILFGGPRLNWILDPGSAIVVAWAAWQYTRHNPRRQNGVRS